MESSINQQLLLLVTIILLNIVSYHKVAGQAAAQIVKLTEEVVSPAGSFAVINCTVAASDDDFKERMFVEWAFLNATGGAKTLTKDCAVIEEHNIISGREKYVITCISSSNTNNLFSLRVDMLSFPDNGMYECRVRLPNEQAPVDHMPVLLTVLSPPKIQTSSIPLAIDTFLNTSVSIPCSAEGVPRPNVTWSRANGRPLDSARAYQSRKKISDTVTSQTLNIANLTKGDSGTYRCSADNNIRPPDEFLMALTVQYKPTVAPVEPAYGTPTGENTQIMIWCRVEGNPRPSMTWYGMDTEDSDKYELGELTLDDNFFDNAQTIVTDEKYKVEQKIMTVGRQSTIDSMFMSLSLLTVEPGDMGYYICRAKNTHGDASTGVKLYRITTFAGQASGASLVTTSIWMSMMALLYLYGCL